jgi:hypothetical protein
MKRIALVLGLLLALDVASAAAQARFHVSIGFGRPRPFVSGLVAVGRPMYRPYFHRRPALVFGYPRPVVVERVYVQRFHRRGHPYRPAYACRSHYRCGY